MTGGNAGSNAGSLAETLAGNGWLELTEDAVISLAETLAGREEGKQMTEYRFAWVGTVKVWEGSRWASGSVIRGTFDQECEDDADARQAFDEQNDRFMDQDFLSGDHWLDGGGPEGEWELNHFHVYRINTIQADGTEGREISPEEEGASR